MDGKMAAAFDRLDRSAPVGSLCRDWDACAADPDHDAQLFGSRAGRAGTEAADATSRRVYARGKPYSGDCTARFNRQTCCKASRGQFAGWRRRSAPCPACGHIFACCQRPDAAGGRVFITAVPVWRAILVF